MDDGAHPHFSNQQKICKDFHFTAFDKIIDRIVDRFNQPEKNAKTHKKQDMLNYVMETVMTSRSV